MLALNLIAVALVLSQSPPPSDPTSLVDQLGSARYADREAATRALEELGRAAMPALQAGRESRDLEVRSRSESILRRIEASLLTLPTMVRLDFHDVPLPEVVATIGQRAGMKVTLLPENPARWKQQRVTLSEPEALPFWKAIDRLCRATSLHGEIEVRGPASRNEPTLVLGNRSVRPVMPTSDHGPFRISLVGLDYQRHVGFAVVASRLPPRPAGGPAGQRAGEDAPLPRPVISVQCSIQMQLMAEPRLGLSQRGPLRILEAIDDRGNSLIADGQLSSGEARTQVAMPGASTPLLHLRAPLHRPDTAGSTIRSLKGQVPVTVMARRPDPLTVPLAGSAGKSFGQGEVRLTVHEMRSDPNRRQRQLELSVQVGGPEDTAPAGTPTADADSIARITPQNLEIIGTSGHTIPWFQSRINAEPTKVTLTLLGGLRADEPRELRYYRISESSVDVPFAFTDLPMP